MSKKILTISAIFLFACAACSLGGGEDEKAPTTGATDKEKQDQLTLTLDRNTESLKRSEVEISSVGSSETGSNAPASTLETSEVKESELEVSRTLSDLNATQTDEGIVINLPENILFDFDKSEIKTEAEPTLKKISELLKYYKDSPMQINGHTDSKGGDSYNQQLSEKRAASVKDYLAKNFDADANRLKTKGFGETKPIAENEKNGKDNPEGREKNRRVEVIIENAKKPAEKTEN